MDEPRHVDLDSRQIRVLAHPLRARLLGELRLDGPATATRLAAVLGTNTGATSYHLRQLAEVGLVADEPAAGRGRERWWRAAHDVSNWGSGSFEDDEDARAAASWMINYGVSRMADTVQRWLRAEPDEPAEWREAVDLSDYMLDLTAEQLGALVKELDQVVERHRRAATPGPSARKILLYLYALPRTAGS